MLVSYILHFIILFAGMYNTHGCPKPKSHLSRLRLTFYRHRQPFF